MFCLAPLFLIGYAFTIETTWHHSYDADAPYVQLQTCKSGMGVHAKGSTLPWGAAGLHYGLAWTLGPSVELTVQPQFGLGYMNQIHPNGHRQIGRFEVGLSVMASYRRLHLNIEYTHLSNGQFNTPSNVGLDLMSIQTGWQF